MGIPNKTFTKYMRHFERKAGRNWQIHHHNEIFQDHSKKLKSQPDLYISKIKLQKF